jgi:hypothetical protein
MRTQKKLSMLAVGLLLMFFISNCKKQESPEPIGNGPQTNNPTVPPNPYVAPAVTFSAPVLGFVVDENNNPVQNATVSTGGQTFTTDANGAFEFASAPFTGNFCYIKAVKNGYFFGSVTVQGKSGGAFATQLVMLKQDNVQTFDATAGKQITVTGGATINFPADAIKKLDGTTYTGNVSVATKYLSPEAGNFSAITPGGDLRAYDNNGKDVMLYSYGMVGVELRDGAGNQLQLAEGKKAEISMPMPASMSSTAPATIPLWYFDENKGVWIEDGEAKLQNGNYVGSVSHFTYWNCDAPGNRAKLRGKIKDCDGDVITDLTVITGQTCAWVDHLGNWERWVPADIDFDIDVRDNATGNTISLNLPISSLANGQEKDLGTITVPCRQKLRATVVDCDNNPYNGYAIVKSSKGTFRTSVVDGKLSMSVFSNGESADLYFHNAAVGQLAQIQITLPANGKSVDLGTVQACTSKTIVSKLSFDYNDGSGVKSVTFENITFGQAIYYKVPNSMSIIYENTGSNSKAATLIIDAPKVGTTTNTADSSSITLTSDKKIFFAQNMIYNIQKYENAGGEVAGTFSGTMLLYDYSGTPTNKQATITNGKFAVLRLPDVE